MEHQRGRTGQSHLDDVDRLQQEQGGNAVISEQGTTRAVAYRGASEAVAGKLTEYAPVNEDPTLAGQNALGARVQYGTEAAQVVDLSGTITTSGAGGSVSTVATFESTSRDVTNSVSLTDRNDPTNPEVFATTVAKAEDTPRLVEVATTGWHEDAEGAHTQAEIRAMTLPSIGNSPVPSSFKYAKPKSAGDPAGMPDWGKSCFVVGIDANLTWTSPYQYREYRQYCWMVRTTSVESEVVPTPTQNVAIQISNLGSGAALLSQTAHNTIFGTNVVSAPSGTTSATTTDVPRWEQSDLTETSDALYYEGASRRRGALAPPEVGDAPDDEIVVSINLKDQYRRDPTTRFTFTDDSGEVSQQWRLFGDEKVGHRTIVDTSNPATAATIYDVGYKQSYMLPPFWGGESDRVIPWMYDSRESLIKDYGMESMVLWPVHLADMNYYLFHVPGFTRGHAADRGHVLNLAYAGYAQSLGTSSIASVSVAGAIASLISAYTGESGEAVAVPVEVKGTSGRKNVILSSVHLNPITPGKVYYPFYDLVAWTGATTNDDYHNTDSQTQFEAADLLKAGVVSPDDEGNAESAYGTNSRFQWTIREGAPVADAEDGNIEALYRRVGLKPAYVAGVGDPFSSDGVSPSAWPNAYISPDDTHVLILTYYEGYLSDKWRFVPAPVAGVPFGDDLYAGLDEVVEDAAGAALDAAKGVLSLTGWGGTSLKDANLDLIPDSGAVPIFQFRRVICRVVIPPEGVVTPATGWTAVTEALADAKDMLVDKVLGAIGKLIGWLEDMPGRVMAGLASLAAESVCHGGEVLAAIGGGENDVGAGEGVQGVDLHVSRTEHADRLSQSRCEDATEKGLENSASGDCTAVAAAVDDPACQSVPPVRFLETFGLPYEVEWNDTPATGSNYRDVWYFSYPGVEAPEGSEAYRAGLSLQEAEDFYGGLPDLTFRLPFAGGGSSISGADLNTADGSTPFGRDLDVSDALSIAGGSDYDGYVIYVRPDPQFFRYVDCDLWKTLATGNDCLGDGVPVSTGNVVVDPQPLANQQEFRFILPRYYLRYATATPSKVHIGAVKDFRFGGVLLQQTTSGTPFCQLKSVVLTDGSSGFSCQSTGSLTGAALLDAERSTDFGSNSVQFIGQSDWEKFSFFMDYVWLLADDSEYNFAISSYRGVPGVEGDWQESPRSPWVTVRGGASVSCLEQQTYWVSMWDDGSYFDYYNGNNTDGIDIFTPSTTPVTPPKPSTAFESAVNRSDRFDCGKVLSPGGERADFGPGSRFYKYQARAYARERDAADATFCAANPTAARCATAPRLLPNAGDPLRGVIAGQGLPDLARAYNSGYLVGSSVCGGIWAGTPSGMTWDSPVVRTVWSIAWVLAMVLLFVLLLWDGFSLSYAGWMTEGRGGVAIGTMLPRFVVALLLASASLFICRLVFTLSADIVCLFIHATGMTFWNFIGSFLLGLFAAVTKLMWPFLLGGGAFVGAGMAATATGIGAPIGAGLIMLGKLFMVGYLVVMLAVMLFTLYYAVKVFAGMVMRVVLLMVLAGLGPVALAMYASPSTEHWTKRWVSLLLGTTFQQVIVLVVLFMGASIISAAWLETGPFEFWKNLFALLAALMVLFLAARIPDIVNPGARGLFAGFGQALMIAGAAAAMVAGGIVGAAAGGLGGGAASGMMGRIGSQLAGFGSRLGGGGGQAPSSGATGAAAGAMQQAGQQSGGQGMWQQATDMGVSPSPIAESGTRQSESGVLTGDAPAMPAAGLAGPAAAAVGGAASGQPGFFARMGRGFMAGAARGGVVGRAAYDLQSGRFFMNDPSRYAGNSAAQTQNFRDYVNRVPMGGRGGEGSEAGGYNAAGGESGGGAGQGFGGREGRGEGEGQRRRGRGGYYDPNYGRGRRGGGRDDDDLSEMWENQGGGRGDRSDDYGDDEY